MFSLVLIASVCVCTYVSHLPSDSSRHLPLLLRGGKVHLLQVREREREKTRVWKRKDNAHTQRAGRRGRMNPHTSHADVLRQRYARYGNSHANGRRTSTENTNDNSSTSTRRRSIRLAAEATAGAGGRGGGGVDARGIPVHLQRTLEAAAYTQAGLLRVSSLQIPESVCASCYRGKVRDTYTLRDGRLLMVATDRASAFDRHVGCIPFKGAFLTATSKYWMDIAREKLDFGIRQWRSRHHDEHHQRQRM